MKILTKKSLGQHFLTNSATIDKILRLAKLGPEDHVLEIGPGPGLMTERIAAIAQQVVAIEKDERLIAPLREKLPGNVVLTHEDILAFDFKQLAADAGGPWKVIANLPYNIATEVIFRLLEHLSLFSSLYLMVQKEVAERLVAIPGNKDYGVLSILVQLWAKTKIVMKLPPGAFSPPPKVDSAVVEFLLSDQPRYPVGDIPTFTKIVRQAFSQRRKMIRNTLADLVPHFEKAGISPTDRPEQIPIEKFVRLANCTF